MPLAHLPPSPPLLHSCPLSINICCRDTKIRVTMTPPRGSLRSCALNHPGISVPQLCSVFLSDLCLIITLREDAIGNGHQGTKSQYTESICTLYTLQNILFVILLIQKAILSNFCLSLTLPLWI